MVIILFGVSGAGKTTVGELLAADLGWEFIDADDFHPAANIAKMSSGRPLDDADRAGWLAALRTAIERRIADRENVVLACSALRTAHRATLTVGPEVKFVYLKAEPHETARRLAGRTGHFMPAHLLASQFATLEEPGPEVTSMDAALPADELVARIRHLIESGKM